MEGHGTGARVQNGLRGPREICICLFFLVGCKKFRQIPTTAFATGAASPQVCCPSVRTRCTRHTQDIRVGFRDGMASGMALLISFQLILPQSSQDSKFRARTRFYVFLIRLDGFFLECKMSMENDA